MFRAIGPDEVRGGQPVARRPGARPRARRRVVHDGVRHAVADQVHALANDALEVDRTRQSQRVGAVVPDRDVVPHDLLAELHERATLLEREAAEADVGEVLHEPTDGVLLEDDLVLAGLELLGAAHAIALLGGLGPERLGVDLADVAGAGMRVARRGAGGEPVHHHRQQGGARRSMAGPNAVRVGDGDAS